MSTMTAEPMPTSSLRRTGYRYLAIARYAK
jgi:hypothetical protein